MCPTREFPRVYALAGAGGRRGTHDYNLARLPVVFYLFESRHAFSREYIIGYANLGFTIDRFLFFVRVVKMYSLEFRTF